MTVNLVEQVTREIKGFLNKDESNRVPFSPEVRFWNEPLIGVAAGDDQYFESFKEIIGSFYMTPVEALKAEYPDMEFSPEEIRVISWVLPASEPLKQANRGRNDYPALLWSYGREYGEKCNEKLRSFVKDFFRKHGYQAVAPFPFISDESFRDERVGWTSRWSERHTAFVAGLGTFGLSDGLITEKGIAMRAGSVVTTAPLPVTPRRYSTYNEYCLFFRDGSCTECIKRCPVGAISEKGHDKDICAAFTRCTALEYARKHYGIKEKSGCGLCQTSVPCESRIPEEPATASCVSG